MNPLTTNGLINLSSPFDVAVTADRLEQILGQNNMKIVARIDHAKAAINAGLELRPTELLLFGNPKAGTPIMQHRQTAAIDFPQKVLVWQDEQDEVWMSFNDPGYLLMRHGVGGKSDTVDKMRSLVKRVATEVAQMS